MDGSVEIYSVFSAKTLTSKSVILLIYGMHVCAMFVIRDLSYTTQEDRGGEVPQQGEVICIDTGYTCD